MAMQWQLQNIIRFRTHKIHPISRPHGRGMQRLLWGFWRNLIILVSRRMRPIFKYLENVNLYHMCNWVVVHIRDPLILYCSCIRNAFSHCLKTETIENRSISYTPRYLYQGNVANKVTNMRALYNVAQFRHCSITSPPAGGILVPGEEWMCQETGNRPWGICANRIVDIWGPSH